MEGRTLENDVNINHGVEGSPSLHWYAGMELIKNSPEN